MLINDASLFAPVFWKPDFDRIARLPYISAAVPVSAGFIHPGGDLPEGAGFMGSEDPGFEVVVNEPLLVKGRLPDPDAPNEIAVPYFADRTMQANHNDLGSFRVGDHVKLPMREELVDFVVVGETAIPCELPPRPQFGWQIHVSRAFLDAYANRCDVYPQEAGCRVRSSRPSRWFRSASRRSSPPPRSRTAFAL